MAKRKSRRSTKGTKRRQSKRKAGVISRVKSIDPKLAAAGIGAIGATAAAAKGFSMYRQHKKNERIKKEANDLLSTLSVIQKRLDVLSKAISNNNAIHLKFQYPTLAVKQINEYKEMVNIQKNIMKTAPTENTVPDAKDMIKFIMSKIQEMNDIILEPTPRDQVRQSSIEGLSPEGLKSHTIALEKQALELINDLNTKEEVQLLILDPESHVEDLKKLIKQANNVINELSQDTIFRKKGIIDFLYQFERIIRDYKKIFPKKTFLQALTGQ